MHPSSMVSMPNQRLIAGSVLLLATMSVSGATQVSLSAMSGQIGTNGSRVAGAARDSARSGRMPFVVRRGPVTHRAGITAHVVSRTSPPVLQERQGTPGRGWLIFAGVLVGAYLGMQATDCEGCFLPDVGRMVVGGILGGWIVSSAIP